MADQINGLLSPFLRNRRFAAARPHLRGRVLDIGCGIGELAGFVAAESYVGVDLDADSIADARSKHPQHRFLTIGEFERYPADERFDTIVALAIIEHVSSPRDWLMDLRRRLRPGGQMVLTTPHPRYRKFHDFGARLGIFSREGAKEHQDFLDSRSLGVAAGGAGLQVASYRRFLMGANQLFVLRGGGA